MILMDFPSWKPERLTEYPDVLLNYLGNPETAGVYQYREYMVELMNEEAVRNCKPDFSLMRKLDKMVIITAPGKKLILFPGFLDHQPELMKTRSQGLPILN